MGNDVKYLCSCSDEENKITNKNEYTIVRKLLIKNETTYNHNTVPEDKSKLDITGLDFKVAKNRRTDVNLDTGVGEPFSNRAFDSIYEEKDNLIESTITYNDKSEYIGTVLKAQRHGKGIYKGIDGLIYEGEWKNDLYEGLGSLTYTDSSKYTGNFKQGKKEGKGKYEAGKIIYEGEFLNDMKHSLGKESYPDGSFYVGSFFMGFKNGDGMYSLIDGSVYIGEFKSDNINGKGTFKWVDDKTYSGEWKDNTLHGYGVLNKMGKIYMGYFQNNNKHGLGKYYYKGDKDNYLVGNFKENALYGLTLNFINDKMDKLMIMEKNKVKKTLNIQEVEAVKLTKEYSKLLDFLGNVHTLE